MARQEQKHRGYDMQRSMTCLASIMGSVLVLLSCCDLAENPASVVEAPNATTIVPASSLGYYYAYTEGPAITAHRSDEDPSPMFSAPPDGLLAPFFVEIPAY
jgi:hypothetical protein